MSDEPTWRAERREALAAQAAALDRRRAAETAEAREHLAGFVRAMTELDVPPVTLRARVPHSHTTYRTNLTGWYLRRNRSLAVSTDGEFFILDVPASVRARLFGAQLAPTDPPLIVGKGARDGESIPLEKLLWLRIEEEETGRRP